jgi:hypothetical protein
MKPILAALETGVLPVPSLSSWRRKRLSLITADDLARAITRIGTEGLTHPDEPIEPSTIASMGWQELADAASTARGRPVRTLAVPSALLYGVGWLADGLRALGLAGGVLGRGKAAEMLHDDWSARTQPRGQPPELAAVLSPFLRQPNTTELTGVTLRSERPHA